MACSEGCQSSFNQGPLWDMHIEDSPILATAIHQGHGLSQQAQHNSALTNASRLREEDPFTGTWAEIAPSRIVVNRSRFDLDLNRDRLRAVYRQPEHAWGLDLWHEPPTRAQVLANMHLYNAFYSTLESLLGLMEQRWGYFVVLDIHSYNHRRGGMQAPVDDPLHNPEINIGTGTLSNRAMWEPLLAEFMQDLRQFDFNGRMLDVRENQKFQGGEMARWIHSRFPFAACVISIEVKKFFMDEWTGLKDEALFQQIGQALSATLPSLFRHLASMQEQRPME